MFGKKKEVEEAKVQELQSPEEQEQEEQSPEEMEDLDELDEMAKKTKKKLPNWLILVVVGVIILIAVVGQALAGGTKKKTIATTVDTYKVKTGDVQEVESASGLVDSENKKIVYSPVNAKVTVCNAKVGQLVKAGDKLIEFDTTKLEEENQTSQMGLLQTQQANSEAYQAANKAAAEMIQAANEANQELCDVANALADKVNAQGSACDQAWAAYNKAKANADSTETKQAVKDASDKLAIYKDGNGNYTDAYYQLTSAIEKTKAELDENRNDTTQAAYAAALKAKDDIDKNIVEWEAVISAPTSAAASALAAAQAQDSVYNDLYSQWQSAYQAAVSGSGSVDTDSVAVKGSAQTSMELSSNAAELEAMTAAQLVEAGKKGLSADFDGVIAEVQAAVDVDAMQGAPMYTLVDTSKMMVQIEVPTTDYAKFKVGQEASLVISNNTYKGQVSNINGMATTNEKGNQVIVVTVKLLNADANIVIGANAKVSMVIAEAKDTIYIPTEALNVSADGDFVYVLKDGKVKETPVTIGISSDSKIEIKKGLKKGDEVISDTSVDLKDGMEATAKGE
ncbi:MAG: efflux RND transporter periplasmic adaptor subunit [Hespellia sp.]|nr:efflux RND transporter periplasmic adaptor subunit [Hespellia sp.]